MLMKIQNIKKSLGYVVSIIIFLMSNSFSTHVYADTAVDSTNVTNRTVLVELTIAQKKYRIALPNHLQIKQVKELIVERFQLDAGGSYILMFKGKVLSNRKTLNAIGVRKGDRLQMMSGTLMGTNV